MSTTVQSRIGAETRHFVRFSPRQRLLHAVLAFTFLGLAATGLPLRFSHAAWSVNFATAIGGFAIILGVHKFCAVILSIAFGAHLVEIFYGILVKKEWWMLWGRNSMVPNLKDVQDMIAQMKYFLFLGPEPKFDRFTYWEKLDYWGVFWGMAIIGISGYAMWFAPTFARLVPGSWLNIALLIHGEEALLATGFIFVVHFFNEHLRPHNFPMDVTVFTGTQTEEEWAERHPLEYQRALDAGELENLTVPTPPAWEGKLSLALGGIAVIVGVTLIILTAYAFVRT